ncbi:MAG: DinB family protein [Bacteroidetes bacterium]|jgi:hypothetical protein|nr:DinB family protein [Bacteroidota bacterium]
MPNDIDVRDECDQLQAFYDDAEAVLDAPDAVLFGVQPDASGWSPAQHLYHIWVANGKSLAAALYIAYGRGDADGGPNEIGRAVLEAASIPRRAMQAPGYVTPPDDLDRDALQDALTRSRSKLDAVGEHLDTLGAAEGRIEHPRMGMLDGPQWLRFVRIHSQHHLTIVRDILSSDPASYR